MENITRSITRKPAFITQKAHTKLSRLSKLLAKEKGVSAVTYIDAISIAILEATEKREQKSHEYKTETEQKVTA
jgi:hypothetical protein